jgi:hypothetical protein
MTRRHLAQIGLAGKGVSLPPEAGASHGYPRPMLRRAQWESLNGTWDFAIDPTAAWNRPDEVSFRRTIEVPFAPETRRSGVHDTGLYKAVWYRRAIQVPELGPDERLLLHFGAVDYACTVWIDRHIAFRHEGGYTPFEIDVTPFLRRGESHEIVVRAEDDPGDLAKPRGKQDWQLEPHSIWYPRTTGIWQTVWLERVGRTRIGDLKWTPNLDRWEIGLDVHVLNQGDARLTLLARLHVGDFVLAEDRYAVVGGEVHRRLALSDPGIDDFRNELAWSPSSPQLIDVELELDDESGTCLDRVRSYTALRSFTIDGDRFVLNGRPQVLRMVLDQGYWPDTGSTPPDDEAIRRDVELAKAMGFNGVRKHQKIEDPRYLYWADRLGLLVWEEMPSAYRFTTRSVERLTREWIDAIRRDFSHPCIIAWVPFNESWGVPNLPGSQPERHYVEALYHLTKTLDPTRPVVGNDGWEAVATDIMGIHDYDPNPATIAMRYGTYDRLPLILKRERPGGRALIVDPTSARSQEHPIVLSEFGGISLADARGTTWGYSLSNDTRDLADRYEALVSTVRAIELFSGFCYTQFADTYQEANGLLYADRTPKFPMEQIRAATSGRAAREPTAGLPPAEPQLTERTGAPR